MGAVPDDLALFQAAKWLGVSVWDLIDQPVYYRNRAYTFMQAEESARKQLEQKQGKRQGR